MTELEDHADVKIHPPVLLFIHFLATYFLNRFVPLSSVFPGILIWFGFPLVVIGFGLAFSAVIRFMRARTTLDPHGSVSEIVTDGVYGFSRNPIYLGFVCLLIGFPFIFVSYWGLILSPLFVILMNVFVIQHEEAYLEKKFGNVYTSYKSRVRRWL
jgi:protein-S-isoprenylcysteine O-methyltransferase Ste14